MLNYNELKKGTLFVLDGQPCEILEYEFLRMQQRKPVAKTKIKNLITGKIVERNFHQNENFAEAEIEKKPAKYIYHNKQEYWFTEINNPAKRFSLSDELVGLSGQFLKPNSEVSLIMFGEKIIGAAVPIKVELKVDSTPPGERGNTAQGGTKTAALETGAVVQVPLFVNDGDIVRVNTELGTYVERVEKAR